MRHTSEASRRARSCACHSSVRRSLSARSEWRSSTRRSGGASSSASSKRGLGAVDAGSLGRVLRANSIVSGCGERSSRSVLETSAGAPREAVRSSRPMNTRNS